MSSQRLPLDPFLQLVFELRRLDNDALLVAWKANSAEFAKAATAKPKDPKLREELRLRHNAFRAVAVKRFGEVSYIEEQYGLSLSVGAGQ